MLTISDSASAAELLGRMLTLSGVMLLVAGAVRAIRAP